METLKKKYGLWTGIAMVVGIVIGSGVFIKSASVLRNTGGKLSLSLLAWTIGGLIMVVSAYCFAQMAKRFEKVNGVVDYVEATTNKKVGYLLGWYFAAVYYPILVSILAFVSTNYFYALAGLDGAVVSITFWIVVALVICLSFLFNTIAPKVAGYWQVSTTIIKLIPIFFIAVIGVIVGLVNGGTIEAFSLSGVDAGGSVTTNFGSAILATAFAYEGWVLATSINAELRDSKKNLARALVIGTIIVIVSYLLYYIGLSSIIGNSTVLAENTEAPYVAANKLLNNNAAETIFKAFLVISCLGTLNGLTMGGVRGIYALASRGQGPKAKEFNKLHPKFNVSVKSSLFGLGFALFFLVLWYFAILKGFSQLGRMDELVIALIYTSYFSIYIWIMLNLTELNWFKRYFVPFLACLGAAFLIFSATGLFTFVTTGETGMIIDFLVFAGIAGIIVIFGMFFYRNKPQELE